MVRVLIAIDESCSGPPMIHYYLQKLHKRTNYLTIVHVVKDETEETHPLSESYQVYEPGMTVNPENEIGNHKYRKINAMTQFLEEKIKKNSNLHWSFKCLVSSKEVSATILAYAREVDAGMIIVGTKSTGQVYGSGENQYKMGNTSMTLLGNNDQGIPIIVCPSKGQMYEKIYLKQRTVNLQHQSIQYSQFNDL